MRRALVSTFIIFAMLTGARAEEPQPRIRAYPKVGLEGHAVSIQAFIPRHAANRRMRLDVDGPLSRAFEEDMDGANARVIYPLKPLILDRLPSGEYFIVLTILRADPSRSEGYTLVRLNESFCRGAGCLEGVPQ